MIPKYSHNLQLAVTINVSLNEVCHIGTAVCDGYNTAEWIFASINIYIWVFTHTVFHPLLHKCTYTLIQHTQITKLPKTFTYSTLWQFLTITYNCAMWHISFRMSDRSVPYFYLYTGEDICFLVMGVQLFIILSQLLKNVSNTALTFHANVFIRLSPDRKKFLMDVSSI